MDIYLVEYICLKKIRKYNFYEIVVIIYMFISHEITTDSRITGPERTCRR